MTTTNWALEANGTVATSSSVRSGYNITAVQDGDPDTSCHFVNPAYARSIYFTFLAAQAIKVLRLKQSGTATNQVTQFRLEWSTNNSTWNTLNTFNVSAADQSWDFPATLARYWRIQATAGGNSDWFVDEVELWEDDWSYPAPADGDLANEAFYKWGMRSGEVIDALALFQAGAQPITIEQAILTVALWNNHVLNLVHQLVSDLGGTGGGGLTLEQLQTELDTRAEHDDIHFTAIYNAIGNEANAIRGLDQRNLTDVMAAIHLATDNVDGEIVNLPNKIDGISSEISTIIGLQISQLSTDLQTVIGQARDDVKAWVTLNNTPLLALVAAEFAASIAATAASAASAATNSAEIVTDWAATIPDLVDDVGQILDLLQGQGQSDTGTPEWPGVANVTFNPPWTISHADNIPGPMDGVLIDVQAIPNGQSRQAAAGSYRYKGVGWLAFMTDTNHWEPLQQIGCEHGVYVAQSLARASRVAVYCKPGTTLLVRPWTKTAV